MIEVKFYEQADDALLKFAVIIARTDDKWVFCKHRQRETYEIPGGHREDGETIIETAKRELQEETGATDFTLKPICVYSVKGKKEAYENGNGEEESFGMLFFADIHMFEKELHSEIEKIIITEELADNWTYPLIQPRLIEEAVKRGYISPQIFRTTKVYFVRHAQPEHMWEDDRTRPLTDEGKEDAAIVLNFFQDKMIHAFYSSPYQRSYDTIADTAAFFGQKIRTDERLREREKGIGGNNHGMFEKRWADHDYHEENGESIHMVQERNIAALTDILAENKGRNIVIGTHGTALSAILHYYQPTFGCKDFLRIIDWMPYVMELDFEDDRLLSQKEHCHIEKEFKGKERADKV